jgi:uncharacterized Zn finger protein
MVHPEEGNDVSTTSLVDKATRLLNEGRVDPDSSARVFRVTGDHGTYTVVVGSHGSACTCAARGQCSHVAAATAFVRSDGETRQRIEWALACRKTLERRETIEATP